MFHHPEPAGQLRFSWIGWFGGPGTGGADLGSGTVNQIVPNVLR